MPPSSPLLLHLVSLHIILFLAGETYTQRLPILSHCSGNNYTSPSSFETNLHLLLSNLTIATANSPSFFSTYTVGSPDSIQLFGVAQCRLDSSPTICGTCLRRAVAMASPNQLGGCGRNTSAAFRYDYCFLRYSDIPFFGILEMQILVSLSPIVNASDNPEFSNRVQALVEEILPVAAASEYRYAVAAVNNNSGFETNMYGMAWCTMDLRSSECLQCLNQASLSLPTQRFGGELAFVSCTVRFSAVQFYSVPILAAPPPASIGSNPRDGNTSSSPSRGQTKNSTKTIIIGVLFGSVALIVIFIFLLTVIRRMRRRAPIPPFIISALPQSASRHSKDSLMKSVESFSLNLDAIKTATKDFSEENMLGEGGFGVVYKGVLEDGQEIAVKRLSITSKQGLKQLRNEVGFMAKLQHRNLTKLLGCCLNEEKLLVYEYLPNSSLDKYLSDPVRRLQLNWRTRYKIIEGIGRGLLYLHEDSSFRIIHRDLKASNILLDINMDPKISDFGIAKLFNIDQTRGITSQVVGTFGYMSPEYALHGNFSTKSDVYSYGVLIFEIIAGRCNNTVFESGTPLDFLSHVWHCWNQGMACKIIDQSLGDRYSSKEALKCIHIGLLCIQEDPALRPSMSSLVAMLTTNSVALLDPQMPTFLKQMEV